MLLGGHGGAALAEGLLEQTSQLLELVMVQHPVSFQLFQNEMKRLVARHGARLRPKVRTGLDSRWLGRCRSPL